MRILVTGAAGYVGTAVVRELARAGHDVVALAHRNEPRVPQGVEVLRGSILDPAFTHAMVRRVDGAVHLVARTNVREAGSQPRLYYRTNVVGTLNLLDALTAESERTGSPVRLVFASTAAVYGAPAEQPIKETAAFHPLNPYASTKVAAEEAVRWHAATGELGAVTLRFFNAAGAIDGLADPDRSRIIPKVAAVALGHESELLINGDGTAVRDFVHVMDVARAVAVTLVACEPGKYDVFNVGATPASVLDIVAATEKISGGLVRVRHRAAVPGESPALIADTSRLRDLGWTAEHSALEQIVQDQLQARAKVVEI